MPRPQRSARRSVSCAGSWSALGGSGTSWQSGEHDPLEGAVMLNAAHDAPGTGRREPVRGQQAADGRVDLDGRRAQPVPQRQVHVGEPGWDRVAVASERDRRVGGDDTSDLDGRGERESGQRQQRLGVAEHTDSRLEAGRGAAGAGVAGTGEEAVQGQLRLLRGGRGHGPPPPPAREAHRGFDRALAVPAPWWARLDDRAVVLRHRRERRLHVTGARHDHRRQPVRAPYAGGAAETAHHGVHRLDEVRLIERLGQHAAGAARVRERPEEHEGGAAPRCPAPLEPVPLDLLCGAGEYAASSPARQGCWRSGAGSAPHIHRASRKARRASGGRYRPGRVRGGAVLAMAFSLRLRSAWR